MFLVSFCRCLHWSPVLSREYRCSWNSVYRRYSNYIWVINKCIAYSYCREACVSQRQPDVQYAQYNSPIYCLSTFGVTYQDFISLLKSFQITHRRCGQIYHSYGHISYAKTYIQGSPMTKSIMIFTCFIEWMFITF